jgi:hypothetical protein
MIPALVRRPLLTGCAYGVGVWLMMSFVVIPLSAIGSRSLTAPIVINGLLIHLVGVGIPAVLFARAAGKTEQAATRVG